MKRISLILAVFSVSIWIINYFTVNRHINLAPRVIFESDYQGRQLILRNINLYPNILLARLFQNKGIVITNKYFNNFFDIIDPNYYLFGSHPREIVEGQNYTRLPLLTLLPVLWFLFISKIRKKEIFLSTLAILVLTLSLFINHYLYDFILWPFFIPMIYFGLQDIYKKSKNFGLVLFLLLLVEIIYELSLALS